jgi:prepilin-type N-terminal cleavage/methylation domain-containing protein
MARGFTLVELLVSLAIGGFIAVAAVSFTSDHIRLLTATETTVDLNQDGRAVADLLARDLRSAGLGVGYQSDNTFAGLMRGTFTVPGGASFEADDRVFEAGGLTVTTDDLGLRTAGGDVRTISSYSPAGGQICSGGRFRPGDLVLMMSKHGRDAHAAKIVSVNPDTCGRASCIDGCDAFTFSFDASYSTGPGAQNATYTGGELFGGYQQLVYFVAADRVTGLPSLHRVEVDSDHPCSDLECGSVVGTSVEALQVRVSMFDELTNDWLDVTADGNIREVAPIRVDLEVVTRSDRTIDNGSPRTIQSALSPDQCYPSPCGETDHYNRDVIRTSVEIRNAGRMQLK